MGFWEGQLSAGWLETIRAAALAVTAAAAAAAGAKTPGITIRCSNERRSKPYVLAAAGILFTTSSVGKTRLIRFRLVPRETGRELLNRTEHRRG